MKRLQWILALSFVLLSVLSGLAALIRSQNTPPSRAEQWKKVDEAENQGLPKTAIELLDPIIERAIKEKAYPEAIKAIARKITNESGGDAADRIIRMRAAVAAAPAEMQPVMNVILANWWQSYFETSAWRISNRTATAELPDSDIRTWSVDRIISEADKTFAKALASEKELQATPVGTYSFLLTAGNLPDKFRPTLFDIVAFDAVNFYASADFTGSRPQDAFDLTTDSPIFGTRDEFLKWEPKTTDADSRTVKAIRLYQKLLAFHKANKESSAFLDVDLHRLRFGWNKAVGELRSEKYRAALEAFAKAHATHELSAMADYLHANAIHESGDYVRAREVATRGMKAFPDSPGGKSCFNLIQMIEHKAIAIATERVWGQPLPAIKLTYKNFTKAHFRIVAADYTELLRVNQFGDPKSLLREKPVQEFSRELPATADYKERTESIPAPDGLKPGFYYLLVSDTENFSDKNSLVHFANFWVTNLSLVTRDFVRSGEVAGLVTDNRTGEPIEGAKVQVWVHNNNTAWKPDKATTTDANGLFRVAVEREFLAVAFITHNGQQIASVHEMSTIGWDEAHGPGEKVVFFTDRSLYRPGQPIHYKGILVKYDHNTNNYQTAPNRDVEVSFRDTNGKEIARHKTKSNAYGSFADSFTAPRNRLLGAMDLIALNENGLEFGSSRVTVEEYKRPKFQVELAAPTAAVKLNSAVKVPGKAMQYNGVPVASAKVTFHVTRGVRFSDRFFMDYGWSPVNAEPPQEITHGTVTTDADGNFTIPFVAKPSPDVPEKENPTFTYSVTADVTDTTGETRSDTRDVNVAYVALDATIDSDEWLTHDTDSRFTISTTTPDNVGLGVKARFKIHALKQPNAVLRPEAPQGTVGLPSTATADQPQTWANGDEVFSAEIATQASGKGEVKAKLPPGMYRASLETQDKFGKPVTARHQFTVVNPAAKTFGVKVPNYVVAPKWSVEVGSEFVLLWGTGYETGRAFIEVERRGKIVRSFWTDKAATQQLLRVPVTEDLRGGFSVHVTQVRDNREYLTSKRVDVPWSNKDLVVKWERFVNKLEPGAKETFTAIITGLDAKKAVAEMVAAMYDESLDAYLPHDWQQRFDVFREDVTRLRSLGNNMAKGLAFLYGNWSLAHKQVDAMYRGFPPELFSDWRSNDYFSQDGGFRMGGPRFAALGGGFGGFGGGFGGGALGVGGGFGGAAPAFQAAAAAPGTPQPEMLVARNVDLSKTAARKNLSETAFFLPHLLSDENGTVRVQFTVPEALTKWKFLGFAHDNNLRSGFITGSVVTARDLMVQPNPPRFLREGDVIEFTAKVSNQGVIRQQGTAKLSFKDANTDKPIDTQLGLANAEQPFDLAAGESKTLSWKITVPDDMGPLTYRTVAATDRVSDGEEGMIPVLSKRVLVQEALALPIRGVGTKSFDFAKLRLSAKSDTIRHQSLTVQMVSQPSWYAVMALPYLMEYPFECSEQTFNRYFANSLARHIAVSDPKIRKVFDQWKNTPALDSPLEKNEDLKSVILDETPWVRQAQAESKARRNVGILFDDARLEAEMDRAAGKLTQMQLENGAWPWFPGGPSNEYLTLYITTGFGRLRHLGVNVDLAPALKSLERLDAWAHDHYLWAQKNKPEGNHLSATMALYLYGRSFFLQDKEVGVAHQVAIEYWRGQAKKFWLQLGDRQSQAHLAIALKRFGDKDTPNAIMKSLKERAKNEEELGMFWRDTELSFSWVHAPIESQAMMIEAFDEVTGDKQAVEDCKVWLLKQKQTQNWQTTKATADAVYALLLRGDNLLSSDALVEVSLGNQAIKPAKVEAGTGFYEQKFVKSEVQPSMAAIQLKKTDKGVSWGSVHWSYLEDISKVTPHNGNPLKLEKKLFKKTQTKSGPVLVAVKDGESLSVGDEVVVRIVLRTDRDMEYVHMKDHRGSGTEPVNVLSRYKYQDGLGYYESTKDTASHFFIDYLPKGTYVFEYSVRVQLKGKYPTGFAHIECMYAPEFNSHSENINLEVK